MGRAKALLPYRGTTLVEYVADAVRGAAGSAVLVGDPAPLAHLGLPVLRDEIPGSGPAGGIYTALRATATDWNLVVACDMPAVFGGALRELINAAEKSESDCVAAASPDGRPEPLCAVYHRRCLPALERAIKDKRLKMRDLVLEIGVLVVTVAPAVLANINTPDEWSEFESASLRSVAEEAS